MTMPEVSPRIWSEVVVSKTSPYVDCHGCIGHAVVERRRIRIAVEVDRVLFEQVGPHNHANVGESQEELIVLIDCHHGSWKVSIHDADIHDLSGIDMASVGTSGVRVRHQSDRAVGGV